MSRLIAAALIAVSACGVAVAVPAEAAPAAPAAPVHASGWTSAALPVTTGVLTGVAEPDDATTWAAGFRWVQQGRVTHHYPLLLAGDNRGWKQVPTAPLPTGVDSRINAVSATSARDGWLAGDGSTALGGVLTEHWNGAAWKIAAAPVPVNSPGGGTLVGDGSGLLGVSASTASDAWAVGWAQYDVTTPDPNGGPAHVVSHNDGLIERWGGDAWHPMLVPAVATSWVLTAVTEINTHDVWAVGYTGEDQPVLLHYDGRTWTHLPTPHYRGLYGEFYGVAANGSNDVWAVGRVVESETDPGHALVAHWDGHHWRQVPTPAAAGRLSAVVVEPGAGVVAVGRTTLASYPGPGADGYGMRLAAGQWQSLGLPGGTLLDPTGITLSPRGATTIVGVVADPTKSAQPMVLTRLSAVGLTP
ncbi:hypothetical protein ABIA33_003912 [Streptacidiphilus sp. MAP12-16]|uniref:hypothetical protein n=1 Tax=Streptacidiphilus sp. MAP12-16 TaxID=3156300 RepID=UPI003512BD77